MLKLFLIFIGVYLCFVVANFNFQTQSRLSSKDLPVQEDLDTFLKPIEALTNNLANNKMQIELNFAIGIFFTNGKCHVHLERVLLDKGQNVPNKLLSRIKTIIDINEKTLLYFHKAAKNDIEFMERDQVIIFKLFDNSTYWMHRLKKMKYEVEPKYSYSELETTYSRWKIYRENVDNVLSWNPSPKNSDVCLVILSINRKFKGNSTSWCPIAKTCYNMLTEGTNFGYALCHRLMFLLLAQLARGCFLLLGHEDEELKQKLCTMAYAEAEYIVMNDYGIVDLMFEIICFCSMDGRLQFLRRTWLRKMFDFQNKKGCFGVENSVMTHNRRLAGCNSHTTGLASGTYAAAVRFILEEYY